LVCVWTSGSSPCSQKGWLFKDKSADELQTHTFSDLFFFADLFSCETEQQQQRQQQQQLNFFEKIDGKSLSQFPPQFPKTKKKTRKRNKLAKSLRRSTP
jgi:hypothetical protein